MSHSPPPAGLRWTQRTGERRAGRCQGLPGRSGNLEGREVGREEGGERDGEKMSGKE